MLIKKLVTLVLTALSLCRPISLGPTAESRIQEIDRVALDRISEMVDSFIEAGYVVGAELLIIHDRRTVLHKAYGDRDIEAQLPMERGTLFNIRSMAKPIVGSIAPFTIGSGTTWYSTPEDYARLLSAWLDEGMVGGEQWLSKESVQRALTPRSIMPYASQVPECEVMYGQMWQVYVRTNEAERGERAAFGHSGSDATYSWVWPEHGLVVLYFTQSRGQRTRLLLEPYLVNIFR